MAKTPELFVGLMSGTSVDGIDAALIRYDEGSPQLLATHGHPIPDNVRHEISAISAEGECEIERLGPLDRQLGALFAEAVLALLQQAQVDPTAVTAIGCHGQTIRHRPPSAGHAEHNSFTLQIGDPNTIAELTGITTVADFRRRDIAAGGEGAPLAPAFHAAVMGATGTTRAIVNIGGIANATLLEGKALTHGFDTGPGNTLLDAWCRKHRSTPYDADGAWSATGRCDEKLLDALMRHPFFDLSGVRSTGKESFHLTWLEEVLAANPNPADEDVQATLCELTAASVHQAVVTAQPEVDEVFVCGGGVHNRDLVARLQRYFSDTPVDTTASLGIDPDWVEAMAFAWLAARCLKRQPGNAPAVTGAAGERVLGGIYLA